MNKNKLIQITEYLDNLPEEKFDYSVIISECGTIGCVIGHLPYIFPEEYKYDDGYYPSHKKYDIDCHLDLGLTEEEFWFITEPFNKKRERYLSENSLENLQVNGASDAKEVSKMIKHFIENYAEIKEFINKNSEIDKSYFSFNPEDLTIFIKNN